MDFSSLYSFVWYLWSDHRLLLVRPENSILSSSRMRKVMRSAICCYIIYTSHGTLVYGMSSLVDKLLDVDFLFLQSTVLWPFYWSAEIVAKYFHAWFFFRWSRRAGVTLSSGYNVWWPFNRRRLQANQVHANVLIHSTCLTALRCRSIVVILYVCHEPELCQKLCKIRILWS